MKGEAERLLYEATAVILMRDGGGQTTGGAAVETEKWVQFPARLECSQLRCSRHYREQTTLPTEGQRRHNLPSTRHLSIFSHTVSCTA